MTLYTTYTYINSELLYQWNHIKTQNYFRIWTVLYLNNSDNENSDPKQIYHFWTNENTKHVKYTVFTTFVIKKI